MLLSNGCCFIKCQLFMSIGFTLGHCRVILCFKGQDLVLFCFVFVGGLDFLSSKETSERVVRIKLSRYPLSRRCVLKFVMLSSKKVLEELFLSSSLFTPDGWRAVNG